MTAEPQPGERVLLQQGSTMVSDRRLVVQGRSIATDQITAASTVEQKPSRRIPLALVLLGIGGAALAVYGAFILVVIGGAWAASQRSVYRLSLVTRQEGTLLLLSSPRRETVDAVVAALSRGLGDAR